MRHVIHILTSVAGRAAVVHHSLQSRVVAVTFSGLATSAAHVIPSVSLVVSFGRFEELCTLASRLCGIVAVADDLRAALMNNLGFWFLRAGTTLALGASNMRLLGRRGRGGA